MSAICLLDGEAAARWLQGVRAGKEVGVALGCFDLLHVGHLRMLRAARAQVDILVVALNQDESVRTLKGEGRPFVPLAERAELLAALEGVDLVTSFAEQTGARILDLLRPEVLVKGTDRTPETVPERAEVEAWGGRVCFLGDKKARASSELGKRAGLSGPSA